VAYAVGGGGMSGGHASQVKIMWTRTLDPKSPDFGYHDVGVVASSDGIENHDAIDPAFLMADGHLWLSYGTYFGSIRMIELDPPPASAWPAISPSTSPSTWRRRR
jgi:arabinan endo-1,5-alpha-L-arabinosidase